MENQITAEAVKTYAFKVDENGEIIGETDDTLSPTQASARLDEILNDLVVERKLDYRHALEVSKVYPANKELWKAYTADVVGLDVPAQPQLQARSTRRAPSVVSLDVEAAAKNYVSH